MAYREFGEFPQEQGATRRWSPADERPYRHKTRPKKPKRTGRDKTKPKRVPGFGDPKPDRAPAPVDQNPWKARPFAGPGARSRKKFGKSLGRRLAGGLRRGTGFGRAWDLAGALDDWVLPPMVPLPDPEPNPANGWYVLSECPELRGQADKGNQKVTTLGCLPGQANGGVDGLPPTIVPPPAVSKPLKARMLRFGLWRWNKSFEIVRFSHVKSWERSKYSPEVGPALIYARPGSLGPAPFPEPNPNLMRYAPSIAPAEAKGELSPEWVLGVSEALGHPSSRAQAQAELQAAGSAVLPVPTENLVEIVGPGTDGPTPPPRPTGRRKPTGRRREAPKVKGSVYYLFAALDALSETAEVVDALFEALPQDVQERWSRGRKGRGMLDNAGQYGIDGADWKLQAVWHNAHKIDTVDFFRNLLANQVEDKLIGSLHRNLPRNFINAAEDGQVAYAKLVKELNRALGLEDKD